MERKIGEIFENEGEWYQCVEGDTCVGCGLEYKYPTPYECSNVFRCIPYLRNDKKQVIFKKLEKYGGPIKDITKGEICQPYTIFDIDRANSRDDRVQFTGNNDDFVYITTELNQKDMEKKIELKQEDLKYIIDKIGDILDTHTGFAKIISEIENLFTPVEDAEFSNMKKTEWKLKPFDLEAAKQGMPVCTRDGRKARIVCYDFKGGDYPIIALVEYGDNREIFCAYSEKGEIGIGIKSGEDLMMLSNLHEGWVNVFNHGNNDTYVGNFIFPTEELAKEVLSRMSGGKYIATVKIEWEE